jgi:DNA-binding IclR family transcriptional regulator
VKPAASTDAGVKSAVRVMQVLELFDEIQRDAPVSEVVERLGFPQSSTSALLKSLVQTGYLDYLPGTRTYVPSARVALLGSWIGGSPVHDGSLGRMMDHLSAETGETIVLASSNGIYAKYIHVIQATNPMRLHLPLGSLRLLVCSAMGAALLRDVSDDAIRLLVRRTNADTSLVQKPVDVRQTLENVDEFRKRGYFFSRGLVTPGAGLIAMRLPAYSANPGRPLAIGIAGLLDSLEKQERRLVRVLRDAIR